MATIVMVRSNSVHILRLMIESYTDYHNRPVESLADRAVEYLCARFAWDLFPQVMGFLQGGQPRRLAVRLSSGEVEVRTFSTHECQRFTEGQDVDSAVSDVESSSNPDNALTVHPTSQANYWDLRGWTTAQTLCSTYCSDSDRDQSRGRKRCRN
jgi:hypothetical protein